MMTNHYNQAMEELRKLEERVKSGDLRLTNDELVRFAAEMDEVANALSMLGGE
jgi:hypothetical protein